MYDNFHTSFDLMKMEIPGSAGNYILVASLVKPVRIEIRSMDAINFPVGLYCYCGSAHGPGGLRARIQRHLKKETRKFWHIDYLKDYLDFSQIWWQIEQRNLECDISHLMAAEKDAFIPAQGFGTSDCRNGCKSHLIGFSLYASIETIFDNLHNAGFIFQRQSLNQN